MEHEDVFNETNKFVCRFTYKFPTKKKDFEKCTIQELLTEDSYPFCFNRTEESSDRKFKFVHYDPSPSSIEDDIDVDKLFSNSYRTRNLFIRARSVMSFLIKEIIGETKISTISKMVSTYMSSLDVEYRLIQYWKYSYRLAKFYSFFNCHKIYTKELRKVQKIPLASKFEIRKERYKIYKNRRVPKANENVAVRVSNILGVLSEDVFLKLEPPRR